MVLCYSSPNGRRHTYLQVQIKIASSLPGEQLQRAIAHTPHFSDPRGAAFLEQNVHSRDRKPFPLRVLLLLTPMQCEHLPVMGAMDSSVTVTLKLLKASFLPAWENVPILYFPHSSPIIALTPITR